MHALNPTDNALAIEALQHRLSFEPATFALVIAGPSGVGKTTLCQELLQSETDLRRCVTTTTRPPRPEEIDGVERHFVSQEEFGDLLNKGAFIEHACVHGHLYGASFDAVFAAMKDGCTMLMDVDIQGVATWQKALGEKCVTVFILPPSLQQLEERLASRQTETETNFDLRMKNAIEELRQASLCDYIIENDQLEQSLNYLKAIVLSERHRAFRMKSRLSALGLN
jgi:guanylate kinase